MKKPAAASPETFSSRRVEALTDGVFAIAMTLLVLDLHVGDLGHITTSAQLWQHLYDARISIVSFIISFSLLGSLWAVHSRQFDYIKAVDRHAVMLNTLRLLIVVFVPLSTSLSGDYSDLVLGRIMLPLNFLLLTVVSYWQWHYIASQPALHKSFSASDKEYMIKRNFVILATSALVLLGSVFIGELAFILFMFIPFFSRQRMVGELKHT